MREIMRNVRGSCYGLMKEAPWCEPRPYYLRTAR
jgi:hypothetical protein